MYTEDKTRQAVCEEKEFGVKLSDNECKYLEDISGERKIETRFNFNSLDEIEASLTEQGVTLSSTDTYLDTLGNTHSKRPRT